MYERTSRLGGQNLIAGTAPYRADASGISRWFADEMVRLGIDVRRQTTADPDLIAQDDPDVVIIATGSTPRRDGFQVARPLHEVRGVNLPHVYTSWDVFSFGGRAQVGDRAVVYDDTGRQEAISVAEALLHAGAEVEFVTRFPTFGADIAAPLATLEPARQRLLTSRFTLHPSRSVVEITPTHVHTQLIHGDSPRTIAADTVVFVGFNQPNRELYDWLVDTTGISCEIHLIGEASSGYGLRRAIADGRAIGLAV
jgi:NADPH-dependent 2,4-dienoyl-CoA reductase/sulfur reductase-like enzyme